jgi:hypothetical protein
MAPPASSEGNIVTRTALRSLLAALAATALLAGCGSMTAGAAAVVGDRRISVSEVQEATADAQTWVGQGGRISQTQILYLLAVAPFVQDLAARYNARASEDDARRALATMVPNPCPGVLAVIRANISLNTMQERIGQEQTIMALGEINQKLATLGFTVNPRYGSFDAKTGRFEPERGNWLLTGDDESSPMSTQ